MPETFLDIKIRVNMPETFLMLSMDPTLIEQVLINLLENACIHSGSSAPIDLTIRDLTDSVSFQVKDYGRGIDEEQLPYIFEGQQRTSATADALRTTNTAQSLPLYFQKKRRIRSMSKCTILIIEDEKNIQTFMGKVLKQHDYRVLSADSGSQGLEMIRSQCPDLILLDLGLPDMNGNDIIREVRTWTSTPIIVIRHLRTDR